MKLFFEKLKSNLLNIPSISKTYSYGTAGFRDCYSPSLENVFFKVGIIAALRSISVNANIGVMVTASHNAEQDNGVKIVDPDGGMLAHEWEIISEKIVNSEGEDFISNVKQTIETLSLNVSLPFTIVIGRDCRSHSPILSGYLRKGIDLFPNSKIIDIGEVITPVLHVAVCYFNTHPELNSNDYSQIVRSAYFADLYEGYKELTLTSTKTFLSTQDLILDTAFGVGSVTTKEFLASLGDRTLFPWNIVIRNAVFNGKVNDGCGAEHVQKGQISPAGISSDHDVGNLLCSFDGDGDRIVFHAYLDSTKWVLLDGDRIAVLVAIFLHQELGIAGFLDKIKFGVVQTAYANGGSSAALRDRGITVHIAKTGVKYLHHKAQELDVGIYFEANGHGTVLFSQKFKELLASKNSSSIEDPRVKLALRRINASLLVINPAVGDALSDLLLCLAILNVLEFDYKIWNDLYSELPSRQVKVQVPDKNALCCSDDETYLLSPLSLQNAINEAVSAVSKGRCFIRPSGTEDVVRIYAEAESKEEVDQLVASTTEAISSFYQSV